MNNDIAEGKWKQFQGEAKSWWGKITDDDMKRVSGKFEVFIGVLQERYGFSHQQAMDEFDKQATAYESKLKKA